MEEGGQSELVFTDKGDIHLYPENGPNVIPLQVNGTIDVDMLKASSVEIVQSGIRHRGEPVSDFA